MDVLQREIERKKKRKRREEVELGVGVEPTADVVKEKDLLKAQDVKDGDGSDGGSGGQEAQQQDVACRDSMADDETEQEAGKTASLQHDQPPPKTQQGLPTAEVIKRLRARSQPIRLFGESEQERAVRLRKLELDEDGGLVTEGQRNDFARTLDELQGGLDYEEMERGRAQAEGRADEMSGRRQKLEESASPTTTMTTPLVDSPAISLEIDLVLLKTAPGKLYPKIYYQLKRWLRDWDEFMMERPEEVKRSHQGKLMAAHQRQSVDNLKPFLKQLRARSLAPDVLSRISEIVHHLQCREYIKANDSYLRLSIGNAAWPIGVTAVGIHERSSQDRLYSSQVAHVLNDETSRKYIQSLKRIMTFLQIKYPPEDRSKAF